MILSFGILILPSKSLAISQNKVERITPTEIRNPLLASRVTGIKGTKKKIDKNKVVMSDTKESLLKNNTFFDCIYFGLTVNNE